MEEGEEQYYQGLKVSCRWRLVPGQYDTGLDRLTRSDHAAEGQAVVEARGIIHDCAVFIHYSSACRPRHR